MSRYTTELRYICSQVTGLESVPYGPCINAALPKIFDFDFPIFNEVYRTVLETKILKHFYMREIGVETYGLWKLYLDETLNRIMPYYNKMYEVAARDVDFLVTEAITTTSKQDKVENASGLGKANSSGSNKGDTTDTVSDTPQGSIQNLRDGKYLSTATISDSNNTTTTQATTENTTTNNTTNNTTDFVNGYRGYAPGDLIKKYYDALVNVDQLVLDELENLFMQLW